MNIRDRASAFFAGERPDRIPYTIYSYLWDGVRSDPAWKEIIETGFGITRYIPTYKKIYKNVQFKEDTYSEQGRTVQRIAIDTPAGSLYETRVNGWHDRYFLQTAEDYRIMKYIIENTMIEAEYDAFTAAEKDGPDYEIPLVLAGRSPMQSILVDMVGLGNFSFHLFDYEEELLELYEALEKQYGYIVDTIAAGPGRYVSMLENFTSESIGPERFAKYHIPVYKKYYPVLQQSGKIIGNHYDGRLKSCKELIAESPIDLIESLTAPEEGDMQLSECRRAWPDKLFWVNIRVSDYQRDPEELQNHVLELVGQGAADGCRLAFEISEDLPVNWKESVPIVQKTLEMLKI